MNFICALCKQTCESSRSDEEALEESKVIFGDIPKEEQEVICEDCYKWLMSMLKIMPT